MSGPTEPVTPAAHAAPGPWETYAHCPGCDERYRAPFGDTFHIMFTVCPSCGTRKPDLSWSTAFKDPDCGGVWRVVTERYVSTSRLLRPSTWGTGYWERLSADGALAPGVDSSVGTPSKHNSEGR